MKIGILTFQNAHNYGAQLQAYALKKYLKNRNYEVEIINYANSVIENNYLYKAKNNIKIGGINSAKKWLKKQYEIMFDKKEYQEKWLKFDAFIKEYITNDEKLFKKEEIDFSQYDYIICGSDQIWNPYLTDGFDDVYFANINAKVKKISYAASLGISKFDDRKMEERFFELIKNFNSLSVREKVLEKYITENTNLDVQTVLDPTLLIDQTEYKKFIKDIPYKNYIFQYTLVDNPKLDNIVKELAEKESLNIVELRYSRSFSKKYSTQIIDAGIEDFLSLIKNAKYVITNSFHGTIFSILFEKKFYCVKIDGLNSRIENILDITNLENRSIECFEDINLVEEIDYKGVKKRITQSRIESEKFLNEALK